MEKEKIKLIAEGAEAKIYKTDKKVIKDRIKKNYRLSVIDSKLRLSRTKKEARLLRKLQRVGVPVPNILKEDKTTLEIEFIDGEKVRNYLDRTKKANICKEIGKLVEKMHNANIVHGDLTTSNLILKKKVYLIDLGLGDSTQRIEDKAVDLHLFKECLVSKHHSIWEKCWQHFLQGYKLKNVIARLEIIEKRGKYKGS